MVASGRNPIDLRRASRELGAAERTFGQEAEELIAGLSPGFRNEKRRRQWTSTLQTYAGPIWNKPVVQIETVDILAILRPIWNTKGETASRVRGRVERVSSAAAAHGRRSGNNPARWRGPLDKLLSARPKRTRHHPALPYPEVPAFVRELREQSGIAAIALGFTIFAATRTTNHSRRSRPNLTFQAAWTVPPERMKSDREHRVPLSNSAMTIVEEAMSLSDGPYLFPGDRPGKPLSDMSINRLP